MQPPSPPTVFVVDDHPVVHFGVEMLLQDAPEFRWCGKAMTVGNAISGVEDLKPDIIVLDLMLGGRDQLDLLGELLRASPRSKILIYSSLSEDLYARRAFRLGAMGFVMKSTDLVTLLEALRCVQRGELCASPRILRALAQAGSGGASPTKPLEDLSDRELHVYRLLGFGMRPRAIAEELSLSVKTVHTYCDRLRQKLQFDSLDELLRAARADSGEKV